MAGELSGAELDATEDLISSNYAEQKNQNLSGVNTLDTRLDDTSMS